MSKKDYELIAGIIKWVKWHHEETNNIISPKRLAREFAVILARTNKRFDKDTFMKACGFIKESK